MERRILSGLVSHRHLGKGEAGLDEVWVRSRVVEFWCKATEFL